MKKSLAKIVCLILAVFLVGSLFVGCGEQSGEENDSKVSSESPDSSDKGEQEKDNAKDGKKKVKLGLSWFNLTSQYLAKLKDEAYAYIEEKGLEDEVEVVLLDAQSDAAKQNSQVDNLIAQNVDAIIMIPFDREAQVPAVKAAKKAGIPMIELCASTAAKDDRTSYVGSDDKVSGMLQMEELAKRAGGKGNMVILHGPTGQNAEVMRHTGAMEVLEEYPDIKIVAEKVCNWSRAEAMAAVENILQSGMDVDIIFSENDEMAMGALKAIEGSGKGQDIIIGGVDAIPDALQAVIDGKLACTVFQNAKAQAQKAIEVAIKAGRGEEIEKIYHIPYELVTQENAQDYVGR